MEMSLRFRVKVSGSYLRKWDLKPKGSLSRGLWMGRGSLIMGLWVGSTLRRAISKFSLWVLEETE